MLASGLALGYSDAFGRLGFVHAIASIIHIHSHCIINIVFISLSVNTTEHLNFTSKMYGQYMFF